MVYFLTQEISNKYAFFNSQIYLKTLFNSGKNLRTNAEDIGVSYIDITQHFYSFSDIFQYFLQ